MAEVPVAVIAGVEVVTIPLKDYAELLDFRRRFLLLSINHRQLSTPRRGKLDRNPEVAVFLAARFGTRSVKDLLKECRKLYGASRTPSLSATYRYWIAVRETDARGGSKRKTVAI